MNFEYQAVGETSSIRKKVSLNDLAVNIITDWMPGVPNSMASGYAELLGNILDVEIWGSRRWFVSETVRGFEKQWKGNTSWMLGVAFSRYIFQLEGYKWWAPVSAFTFAKSKNSPIASYWYKYLNISKCRIKKANKDDPTLLPDYVLARIKGGKRELSFAESKGTSKYLQGKNMPPDKWLAQSKSARFYRKGKLYPATQNLLIATRINPNAERETTRVAKVRAWNSFDPDNTISIDVLRPILVMHYYGICKRIGLDSHADLLAINNYLREVDNKLEDFETNSASDFEANNYSQYKRELELKELTTERKKAVNNLSRIKDEIELETKFIRSEFSNRKFLQNPDRSTFSLGNDKEIRVGLSEDAVRIINWLQGRNNPNTRPEDLLEFNDLDNSRSEQRNDKEIFFAIRSDGVYSERF